METNAKWYTNGKSKNVKVLVCKDYETLSKKAAAIIAGIVNVKPDAILGLATGSSPVGTYKELIRMYNEGTLDFSQVRTYNLDEYYPLEPTNDQSYHYFMDENLFNHVNIDKNNVHVPDGNAEDMNEACTSYEAMLDEIGGVDMQLLGIGGNGHIGFNEPTDTFVGPTHIVELTESTIQANSRFFEKIEDVPTKAISMGVGSIMKAKKIILVANGAGKAKAIADTLEGPITPWVPASVLQLHHDVTIIIDEAAAQYPNTTFIHYDVGKGVEFKAPNVYGITFAQNESSFMAALLQCLMTKNGKVGCISSDSPILNDFSTGWLAGVKYAKNELGLDIEWLHSYMPETSMSAVYEASNVMYDSGCDFVWAISAQMLLASCQAAEEHGGGEAGYWVMGCDYDQYEYFKGLAAEDANSAAGYENILTSITKNIASASSDIIASVEAGDGKIPSGNLVWGVYENGVGYLENENFMANVPAEVQQTLKDIINKIGAGEIVVPSYYDFSTYEAFATYRDNPDAEFVP